MRLLLVEDDGELRAGLVSRLRSAGFAVDEADNGIDGEYLGSEIDYDVVVLDLGLPQRPGLEVLRNWRQAGRSLPVLILTARDAWHEKVDGFQAGADDYLVKPFHIEELLARLQALMRRGGGQPGSRLQRGAVVLDEARKVVEVAGGPPQQLTAIEYRLLRQFLLNPNRVLSKDRLAEHAYEEEVEHDSNVIEVYIARLRRKLGGDYIRTLRGQGYQWQDPPTTSA